MKRLRRNAPRLRGTVAGLALTVGVQTALVLGLTVPQVLNLRSAPVVRLQTMPADPRDLLRGHYLTLNYDFSNAILPPEFKQGQTVYLPLREGAGGLWQAEEAQVRRPEGGVYLRGKVRWNSGMRGQVNYGIERFYLEQAKAEAEDERRWQRGQGPLVARVQVGRSGVARVVGVERDGVDIR